MGNRILPPGAILEGSCGGPLKKNLFETELKVNFFRDSSLGFSTNLWYSMQLSSVQDTANKFVSRFFLYCLWACRSTDNMVGKIVSMWKVRQICPPLGELVTFVRIRLCNGFKYTLQKEIFIGLFCYMANPLTLNSADN